MIVALRSLWHEGWVEHHGDYYDIPPCKMLPAPTKPVPILGGGGSPAALRRAVNLCDGWITHGAGPEDHAWEQLALIHGALEEAGRSPEGFDIYLAVQAAPDVDLYKRFAEAGVTDMLCAPWMSVQLPHEAAPDELQKARVEACERFSDEVIAKFA